MYDRIVVLLFSEEVTMSEFTEDTELVSYINPDIHPNKKDKNISAFIIISESEIAQVVPNYTHDWPVNNPDLFFSLLWEAGVDTRYEIEVQDGLTHRNRMNQIVKCRRWACYERIDSEWINSGNASREAKHKASGNRLLRDLNRLNHIPA